MLTRILLVVALLAGCGSEPLEESERFVGTWEASGAEDIRCNDGSWTNQVINGSVRVDRGVDADLVVDRSCPMRLDVVGGVAQARAGQSCSVPGQGGGTILVRYTMLTIATSDGKVASWSASGALDVLLPDGTPVACTFTETASLSKVAR